MTAQPERPQPSQPDPHAALRARLERLSPQQRAAVAGKIATLREQLKNAPPETIQQVRERLQTVQPVPPVTALRPGQTVRGPGQSLADYAPRVPVRSTRRRWLKSAVALGGAAVVAAGPTILSSDSAPQREIQKEQTTTFDTLIQPAIGKIMEERQERKRREGEAWSKRINEQLNKDRVNLLIYEKGSPEGLFDGTILLASYHIPSKSLDFIHFPDYLRAPEVGWTTHELAPGGTIPKQIGEAKSASELASAVEDATGLSVDRSLTFRKGSPRKLVSDLIREPQKNPSPSDLIELYSFFQSPTLARLKEDARNRDFWEYRLALLDRAFNTGTYPYGPLSHNLDTQGILAETDRNINEYTRKGRLGGFDNVELPRVKIIVDTLGATEYKYNVVPNSQPLVELVVWKPKDGNPHAEDLPSGYWKATREHVEQRLNFGWINPVNAPPPSSSAVRKEDIPKVKIIARSG